MQDHLKFGFFKVDFNVLHVMIGSFRKLRRVHEIGDVNLLTTKDFQHEQRRKYESINENL